MNAWKIDVPVVLFFFNREDTTRRVFEQIKIARPRQLFLISDGPRLDRAGEKEKVDILRKLSEEVDWDCKLYTDYSDENLGCDNRIISGLNMVFEYVDRAVILEDDCLPTQTFFDFCHEILERHENDKEISYIAGGTYVKIQKRKNSYFFGEIGITWGWATWRDRWNSLMVEPEVAKNKVDAYMKNSALAEWEKKWLISIKRHFDEGNYPWDYLWLIGTKESLKIVPSVNLVSNIGFSKESTHTILKPTGYYGKPGELKKPYLCPNRICADGKYIKEYASRTKNRIWNKISAKLQMLILLRK